VRHGKAAALEAPAQTRLFINEKGYCGVLGVTTTYESDMLKARNFLWKTPPKSPEYRIALPAWFSSSNWRNTVWNWQCATGWKTRTTGANTDL
jgi:hypothetical protein